MLLLGAMAFKPDPTTEKLVRKWELVGVQTANMKISEEEIRSKNSNIMMEFLGNGYCIIRPIKAEAAIKKNKWTLKKEEKETYIIMEADNGFGEPFKQNMIIEELSTKKLVLSVGKDKDKEIYTYKALK
jgi:hypothetical protein